MAFSNRLRCRTWALIHLLPHLAGMKPYLLQRTPSKKSVLQNAQAQKSSMASQRRQREREQQAAREPPKTRDRQQASTPPNSSAFAMQNHSHTPENRGSPYPTSHGSQGDHPQYTSPTLARRNAVSSHQAEVRIRQVQQPSVVSQPPPSAAASTRAPDRLLPIQEEAGDDVGVASKNGGLFS